VSHAGRQRVMASRPLHPTRLATSLAVLALVIAACSTGGGPSGSPAAASHGVTTADDAMAAIRARSPLFDGIKRKDANIIGQGSWWDAAQNQDGSFLVTIEAGTGDCQAGCITRHDWTWTVAADGSMTFGGESGAPVADELLGTLTAASTSQGIGGWAVGGPTCPVQKPNDPACAAKMVGGAKLVVKDSSGKEVATFLTDGSGLFRFALDPAEYTVDASPVNGMMGSPGPSTAEVQQAKETWLELTYDTGIR
jgi:hypothetical protein